MAKYNQPNFTLHNLAILLTSGIKPTFYFMLRNSVLCVLCFWTWTTIAASTHKKIVFIPSAGQIRQRWFDYSEQVLFSLTYDGSRICKDWPDIDGKTLDFKVECSGMHGLCNIESHRLISYESLDWLTCDSFETELNINFELNNLELPWLEKTNSAVLASIIFAIILFTSGIAIWVWRMWDRRNMFKFPQFAPNEISDANLYTEIQIKHETQQF